jgi:pyrroline-5-carboxylate reductase
MKGKNIGIIGAGKIGSAILQGAIGTGLVGKQQVIASDVSASLRQTVAERLGIEVTSSNGEVCDFADIVILAVKPQHVDPVLGEIANKLAKEKLLVSVAAGVPLSRIERQL